MSTIPPSRDLAVASVQMLHAYLRNSRPQWSHVMPIREGYYWMRESRKDRAEVVEIRIDYSAAETPIVVQSGNPANVGVQYLRDYEGCEWSGPLEMPT